MSQFIEVIDDVISPELCEAFINRFEQSQNKLPGRTGGGVDTDKKLSLDVSIAQHPEFKSEFQQLLPLVSQQVINYFEKYFFALIGPIGLTVKHPETGQPVKLTADKIGRASCRERVYAPV